MTVGSCEFESHLLHNKLESMYAEIAQLVEHNLAPKEIRFQPWQGERSK